MLFEASEYALGSSVHGWAPVKAEPGFRNLTAPPAGTAPAKTGVTAGFKTPRGYRTTNRGASKWSFFFKTTIFSSKKSKEDPCGAFWRKVCVGKMQSESQPELAHFGVPRTGV